MNTCKKPDYVVETVTGPASEPVSLDDLKGHLRLSGDEEDAQLSTYISAAREQFEFSTDGRTVLPTTYRQWMTGWDQVIKLRRAKATSVSSVRYFDTDDTERALTGWSPDLAGDTGLVYLPNCNWPALSTKRPRPVRIEFVAGWADVDSVPASVKLSIMLLAGHWYEHRESHSTDNVRDVPMGFQRFADQWKTGFGGF